MERPPIGHVSQHGMTFMNNETPLQSRVPHAMIGKRVGKYRVSDDSGQLLRLGVPQMRPMLWLGVAVIAVVVGLGGFVAWLGEPNAEASGKIIPPALSIWIVIGGVICAAVGLPGLGLGYTVDGSNRSVTKRRIVPIKTWENGRFRFVSLTVTHYGPNEILVLSIDGDSEREVLAKVLSTAPETDLPTVAARIASLLDLPVHRAGNVVQAGAEVRAALELAGPVEGPNDGRDLIINCPACGRKNVSAVSFDLREHSRGITHTTTWVRCLTCKTDLYSQLRANDLSGCSPESLARILTLRVSLIRRALAVLAVITCPMPAVGFVMALSATLANWRTRGWPKITSRVALAIATVVTGIVTIKEMKGP